MPSIESYADNLCNQFDTDGILERILIFWKKSSDDNRTGMKNYGACWEWTWFVEDHLILMTEGITWMIDNHSIPCKQISAMRAINMLHAGKFSMFVVVCWFFSKFTFLKNYFRNTIEVSNSLDPDQARPSVWPDLATNCLQGLSTDDKLSLVGKELRRNSSIIKESRW